MPTEHRQYEKDKLQFLFYKNTTFNSYLLVWFVDTGSYPDRTIPASFAITTFSQII